MLNTPASTTQATADDREARIQALLQTFRPDAEHLLRHMAEQLVDLPDHQAFGQIEYTLRDASHRLAAAAHQAALRAGKKKGT